MRRASCARAPSFAPYPRYGRNLILTYFLFLNFLKLVASSGAATSHFPFYEYSLAKFSVSSDPYLTKFIHNCLCLHRLLLTPYLSTYTPGSRFRTHSRFGSPYRQLRRTSKHITAYLPPRRCLCEQHFYNQFKFVSDRRDEQHASRC